MKLDLPQPLGPRMAVCRPSGSGRLTPASAAWPSRQTRASSSSIRAGLAGRAGVMDGGGDEPGDSIRSRRAGLAEGRAPSCRGSLRFDTAMPASLIDFLAGGLLQFGFWQLALYLLDRK